MRRRAIDPEELVFEFGHRLAGDLGAIGAHFLGVGRAGGSRQQRIDGDARALQLHGEAARDRELRGLGHAVVDHLARDVEGGFAGDEQHAAPAVPRHLRGVVAREADAAHDVDLEQTVPLGVGNFEGRLALVDAEVVDEDVDLRRVGEYGGGSLRGGAIRSDAVQTCPRDFLADGRHRLVHVRLLAAGDGHMRTFPSEALGNGVADAAGGARHERTPTLKLQIHAFPSVLTRAATSRIDSLPLGPDNGAGSPFYAPRSQPTTMQDAASRSPAEIVDAIAATARKVRTPCGEGSMVWRVWGSGEPLILLHGGSGSWTHWIRNIPELSRHYELWVPDIPGLGDSAMPPKPWIPASIADVVVAGIDEIFGSNSTVRMAGFSFGGHIAGLVAARLKQRVSVLTLIGVAALGLRADPREPFSKERTGMSAGGARRRLPTEPGRAHVRRPR